MSSRRMSFVILACAAFVLLLGAVSLIITFSPRGVTQVALPSPAAPETGQPAGTPDAGRLPDDMAQVVLSPDTVQETIRSLRRPEAYSREITIYQFWDGQNGSAVWNYSVAVAEGVTAIRATLGSESKHIIVTPEKQYSWYPSDRAPFVRETDGDEPRYADEYQMLMTYEDVIDLQGPQILRAEYTEYYGENCILVSYRSGELGYTTHCYISVRLGLLFGADVFDGDEPIYKMTTEPETVSLETPDRSRFELPDGTNVLDGPAS